MKKKTNPRMASISEKCDREIQQKGKSSHRSAKATSSANMDHKKKMGQYFTISEELQQYVFDKVKHKGSLLLEPSFGAGHLLRKFKDENPDYPMMCYELDDTIQPTVAFNTYQSVVYGDFTKQTISATFKTIIGNPPYIKQRTGNLYIEFIKRCFSLLDHDGELIFIVPSDFIKITSASSLINDMIKEGSFTDFLFPHDEKLFEGASVDVVVFRYEKGLHTKDSIVNGKKMICNVNSGIITFSETEINGTLLSTLFDVYVGLVSGKDEIYRNNIGNMNVLCDKERTETFIFAESFPTGNPAIDTYLMTYKDKLLERKIRKFNEKNWFEWGAPRNITSIQRNMGAPCIYVRNMTRNQEVAFIGTVQYFGGTLLCLVPKDPTTDLEKIVEFLNTKRNDYLYSGRFKIGHKQVCHIII